MAEMTENAKWAFAALLRAHASLVRKMDAELAKCGGMPMEQYDVLLTLEDATEGRLTMGQLADRVCLSPSGITRLVDRLERLGFVRRIASSNDRRRVEVGITSDGLVARKAAWPHYRDLMAELWAEKISEEEASTVRRVLERYAAY